VVDLKEQGNTGKSRDSRFLKKILTDAEIEYIKNAASPDLALWSLWACKETAYKVVKKYLPDTAFVPRRWNVVFKINQSGYAEGEVGIFGKGGVYFRLFSNSDYVHCVGTDNVAKLDKLVSSVDVLPEDESNPSLFSRYCLAQNLAKHFSINFHQIKIKRTRQDGDLQPPRVYVDGRTMDIDVSLSHDGRFVAFVYSLSHY